MGIPEYTCPDCRCQLELVDGEFGTGVYALDGTEQMAHEEGYFCSGCKHVWSAVELLKHEVEIELADLPPDPEPGIDALQRWLS